LRDRLFESDFDKEEKQIKGKQKELTLNGMAEKQETIAELTVYYKKQRLSNLLFDK